MICLSFLATIYAFNTNINQTIAIEASQKNVPIRTFNVIYHMLNDIKDELTKLIPSTEEDIQTGSADVLQTFDITDRNKKIPVAGCRVTDGSLEKKQLFKLIRNGKVVHRGKSNASFVLKIVDFSI
jgi:translation initiation factor IF-2